ncbi:MAG: purine-binding chemotaxis protein CheW [Methylobacteriaceae bacterium]|nr:purine-binding chemotaxis protein CheW [Methylobacteriaceae bacterium]MBV9704926.1 purine-binding chemotaxis protein CheW [Methylobacteriaceae bacterium]
MSAGLANESSRRAASRSHEFVTISCADETFGLPVRAIRTVFRIERVTRVPRAPAEFVGLVNARGTIVPIFSLRRRLGLEPERAVVGALAIGLDRPGEAALLVDGVGDVVTLQGDLRVETPPHIGMARAGLISAVYRLDDRLLSILDIDALFRPYALSPVAA